MARGADEARVVERIRRLSPQQKSLELAVAQFVGDGDQFDKITWTEAFESQEPEDILRVKGVTGLYEGLVNHMVELFRFGTRLTGIEVPRADPSKPEPTVREVLDAVAADGGLTSSQVETLWGLYGVRNELQHASPGVEAGEVYESIQTLRKTLKRFVQSYVDWLKAHDVKLT